MACMTEGREMGAGFLVGKPEGKRPRGIKKWIRGMIILKVTLKKEVRWVGSFFLWFRLDTSGGPL